MNDSKTSSAQSHFVFREAESADELEQLLRLRYRVYRECKLARFVEPSAYEIDLDCYDFRSSHFGLFKVSGDGEMPVGYLRVAEDGVDRHSDWVAEVAEHYPGLAEKVAQTPAKPFPLMNYFPDADLLQETYTYVKEWGERLVEPCRLALDASHRSVRLGKHIVESAIVVYFFARQIEHAVMCCDSATKHFYGIYGFRQLPGTYDGDFAGLGQKSTCVFGSADSVPGPARERLLEMTKAYKTTGRICCHPDNSHLFHDDNFQVKVEDPKSVNISR